MNENGNYILIKESAIYISTLVHQLRDNSALPQTNYIIIKFHANSRLMNGETALPQDAERNR